MNESLNSGSETAPIRKSVVIILVLVLLGGIGALVAHFLTQSKPPPITTSESEPSTAVADTTTNSTPAPGPIPTAANPPVVTATSSAVTRVVPAVAAQPQVSPYARQIVTALAQLNMTNGPMTQEKLAAWRST